MEQSHLLYEKELKKELPAGDVFKQEELFKLVQEVMMYHIANNMIVSQLEFFKARNRARFELTNGLKESFEKEQER